jgi:hypothetical protein
MQPAAGFRRISCSTAGGDAMPTSFEKKYSIHEEGFLAPSGPLDLAQGEHVLRLDIWIFQDDVACMGFLKKDDLGLNLKDKRWTMNPDYQNNNFGEKKFQRGGAVAMGLLVKKKDGETAVVEQWSRAIILE